MNPYPSRQGPVGRMRGDPCNYNNGLSRDEGQLSHRNEDLDQSRLIGRVRGNEHDPPAHLEPPAIDCPTCDRDVVLVLLVEKHPAEFRRGHGLGLVQEPGNCCLSQPARPVQLSYDCGGGAQRLGLWQRLARKVSQAPQLKDVGELRVNRIGDWPDLGVGLQGGGLHVECRQERQIPVVDSRADGLRVNAMPRQQLDVGLGPEKVAPKFGVPLIPGNPEVGLQLAK